MIRTGEMTRWSFFKGVGGELSVVFYDARNGTTLSLHFGQNRNQKRKIQAGNLGSTSEADDTGGTGRTDRRGLGAAFGLWVRVAPEA
jgi:hypothetical protein